MTQRSRVVAKKISEEIDTAEELLNGSDVPKTPKKMSKSDLAAAVKAEQVERVQACATAIAELLERYGCELGAVVKVSADGRLAGEVQLLAK